MRIAALIGMAAVMTLTGCGEPDVGAAHIKLVCKNSVGGLSWQWRIYKRGSETIAIATNDFSLSNEYTLIEATDEVIKTEIWGTMIGGTRVAQQIEIDRNSGGFYYITGLDEWKVSDDLANPGGKAVFRRIDSRVRYARCKDEGN